MLDCGPQQEQGGSVTLTKWIVEQLDQVKPNLLYGLLMRVLELDLRPLTAIPADTVLYKVIVLFRCTAQICCTLDGGKSLVMPLISVWACLSLHMVPVPRRLASSKALLQGNASAFRNLALLEPAFTVLLPLQGHCSRLNARVGLLCALSGCRVL